MKYAFTQSVANVYELGFNTHYAYPMPMCRNKTYVEGTRGRLVYTNGNICSVTCTYKLTFMYAQTYCYRQKLLVLASTALSMVMFYRLRNVQG